MTEPSNSLNGKVALVTGSGGGMGHEHAVLLAERGADVIVHDLLVEGANKTADKVRAAGRRAVVSNVDIGDLAGITSMIEQAQEELGPIDILINNAGISEHRDVHEIDEAGYDRMFDVHVKGSFFCTQAVLPGMKQKRYGKIINVSSIWGMTGYQTASHYCAAKAAMLGFTKAWAKEFAPFNIHVNAIAPGGVLTPMPIKVQGMEKIRQKEKLVPLGRWAQPEEVSYLVGFLASHESDFITGQVISPNGGEVIVGI